MIPGTVSLCYLHPGQVSHCFHESLASLLFHDATNKRRITSHLDGKLSIQVGSGGIVSGRNSIVSTFLDKTEAEWLFWIDSDMGFDEDTVDRLIEAADPDERPVVGGLAFALKSDGNKPMGAVRYRAIPTVYAYVDRDDEVGFTPQLDYPRDELIKVAATGGAIVLVHRTVLEQMRDRFGVEPPHRWYDPIPRPKGGGEFSEDMSFCVRVAALDLPLYVHTGIKTTHEKNGCFLDEEFYDRQEAARPKEQALNRAERRRAQRDALDQAAS